MSDIKINETNTPQASIFEGDIDGMRVVYGLYGNKKTMAIVVNGNIEEATKKVRQKLAKIIMEELNV
jgi:hypothetical protein